MLQSMNDFIKEHKKAILLNIVVVCICYIHLVFIQNVGIDTEVAIKDTPSLFGGWSLIGRQGLVFTKIILKLTQYNPYFAGVIFLVGFVLLGISTAFLCWVASGKNDVYPYGLFMVLFSTSSIWMNQFYFALQRAEVVLGLIYVVISVFSLCQMLFYKNRKLYWLAAYLVFGVWSFCSYQGCVMFYIALCIVFFLMDFMQNYKQKQWQEYGLLIVQLIGGFLLIYLVNMAITKIFFEQGEYLQGQIGWGKMETSQILHNMYDHVKSILLCRGMQNRSAYPFACLCIALLFVGFCMKREIKKSLKCLLFFALAGLMATPFLLTIYLGNIPVPRSQFALQLVSAFGCMFAYGIWKAEGKQINKWMSYGIVAVSCVIVWFSLSTIFRLQYTDDMRYQQDVRVACEIAEEIQETEGAEGLPVIFVGGYVSNLNASTRGTDMYGYSFLGWDYHAGNLVGATGRIEGFMKTLGIDIPVTTQHQEKAVKLAKKMECYPKPGYISVQDKFVVVKLSEIN